MRETSNFSLEIMIPITIIPLYWWGNKQAMALIGVKYGSSVEEFWDYYASLSSFTVTSRNMITWPSK